MSMTSIASVFEEVIKALEKSDPGTLQAIGVQSAGAFTENVAYFQRAIGLTMAYTAKDIAGPLAALGWLVVALAELSTILQNCNNSATFPERNE